MLPDAIQGEKGRVISITCVKRRTPLLIQAIIGGVITGIIETIPGPDYTTRYVSGSRAVVDGPGGIFTWTWNPTDTATAGDFRVQFIVTVGGTVIYKSYPEPWRVIRSPATPDP